jgi:hypothetical protein
LAILRKKNPKKLIKQHFLETVFFGITIICAVTLIVPLWNYTQLYNALYNFTFTIPRVNINTSQLNSAYTAQINFTIIATNPTGYSGLRMGEVSCSLGYYGTVGGITNWWPLTTLHTTEWYTLGSNSNITIPFDTTISGQVGAFQGFIIYLMSQVPSGQISWQLTCGMVVTSFLANSPLTEYFQLVTPLS